MKRINALTIVGTDSSGSAGIQADLKTLSALDACGCSAITALAAQNTHGVQSVYHTEPDSVAAQLDSVFGDVRIDTTRIDMLTETDIVEAVAERLQRYQIQNVVLDTVILAKSGDPLFPPSAVATLRSRLLPQASLITPNSPEAAALLDAPHARTEQEMLEQGRSLLAMSCDAVLMKGGHLDDEQSPNWLFARKGEQRFTVQRIMIKNTHGTGCVLSAALVALRPRHMNWANTVQEAKSQLSSALARTDTLEISHDIGPVHHFHAWWWAPYYSYFGYCQPLVLTSRDETNAVRNRQSKKIHRFIIRSWANFHRYNLSASDGGFPLFDSNSGQRLHSLLRLSPGQIFRYSHSCQLHHSRDRCSTLVGADRLTAGGKNVR